MGRFVRVIWAIISAPFVMIATMVVCSAGFAVIKPREDEELQERETKGVAVQVDPELDNEDERRRWLADLTLADRLKTVDRWYGIQAAEVGVLPEPVEVWQEKREQKRREMAARN